MHGHGQECCHGGATIGARSCTPGNAQRDGPGLIDRRMKLRRWGSSGRSTRRSRTHRRRWERRPRGRRAVLCIARPRNDCTRLRMKRREPRHPLVRRCDTAGSGVQPARGTRPRVRAPVLRFQGLMNRYCPESRGRRMKLPRTRWRVHWPWKRVLTAMTPSGMARSTPALRPGRRADFGSGAGLERPCRRRAAQATRRTRSRPRVDSGCSEATRRSCRASRSWRAY